MAVKILHCLRNGPQIAMQSPLLNVGTVVLRVLLQHYIRKQTRPVGTVIILVRPHGPAILMCCPPVVRTLTRSVGISVQLCPTSPVMLQMVQYISTKTVIPPQQVPIGQ